MYKYICVCICKKYNVLFIVDYYTLKGQLPEVAEGEVTRQVCTQTFTGLCSRYWDISVKNCQDEYYVYRLEAALEIDSGYCFGR